MALLIFGPNWNAINILLLLCASDNDKSRNEIWLIIGRVNTFSIFQCCKVKKEGPHLLQTVNKKAAFKQKGNCPNGSYDVCRSVISVVECCVWLQGTRRVVLSHCVDTKPKPSNNGCRLAARIEKARETSDFWAYGSRPHCPGEPQHQSQLLTLYSNNLASLNITRLYFKVHHIWAFCCFCSKTRPAAIYLWPSLCSP